MDESKPPESPPKVPVTPAKRLLARLAAPLSSLVDGVPVVASLNKWLKEHLGTSLYRNAYYLMVGAAVNSGFTFVFWIVAARFYPAAEVGLATAAIAALGLLSSISDLGLGVALIRYLPGANNRGNSMINTCYTISSLTSVVITAVFLAGLGTWSPELMPVRQHPVFFASFLGFAVIWTLDPQIDNTYIATRSTKFVLAKATILSSLRLGLIVLFAAILDGAFAIFAAASLALLAVTLLNVLVFVRRAQPGYHPWPTIKKDIVHTMWRYAGVNYIARLLLVTAPLILTLMVVNILGAEMNAYFYIPWSIASVLMMVPASIFNSLFAEGSHDEESVKSNVRKSLKLMALILLPIVLVVLAVADKLLLIFGSDYSHHGAVVLRISAVSTFAYGINYLYITLGRIKGATGSILAVSAAMTTLSLGLSGFLMLRMDDLAGAAVGWLAGQGIVALAVAVLLVRGTRS